MLLLIFASSVIFVIETMESVKVPALLLARSCLNTLLPRYIYTRS